MNKTHNIVQMEEEHVESYCYNNLHYHSYKFLFQCNYASSSYNL